MGVNPYAPPVAVAGPPGAYAARPGYDFYPMGDQLVVRKGTVLPDICVVSGQPTGGMMKHRNLSWIPPWVGILFVISPLLGLIVMMFVRKSGPITHAWSAEARSKRTKGIIIGLSILASTFLLIGIGIAADAPALAALSMVTFITGLIMAIVMGQPFRVAKIDNEFIYLKMKPAFMSAMQPYFMQGQPAYGAPPSPYGAPQSPYGPSY
jgi:hypothetical protein